MFRKYYKEEDGLTLDVGAFAKALEYATGVTAKIVGKPQADFFLAAVKDMGISPNEVSNVNSDRHNLGVQRTLYMHFTDEFREELWEDLGGR